MARWSSGHRVAGRFVVEGRLASGGMGDVYVARMSLAGGARRRVAVKRIHPHLVDDPHFARMFLDEVRISSQLGHPGLVPVIDAIEHGKELLLVLELVPGWDLATVLDAAGRRGLLVPLPAVLYVGHSLASTLEYVHSATDVDGEPLHIVHRDISPSNVLVAEDGSVRLLDFGVAKAASRLTRTPTNTLKGKFAYMAPEQVRGAPVDSRADLYALGLLLFEMLTGRRALDGPDDISRLQQARDPTHVLPSALRPDTPEWLDQLVYRLLAPAPSGRPGHAALVLGAIEAAGVDLVEGAAELRGLVRRVMGSGSRPVAEEATPLEAARARAAGVAVAAGAPGGTARLPAEDEAGQPEPAAATEEAPLPPAPRPRASLRRALPLLGLGVLLAASAVAVGLAGSREAPAPPEDEESEEQARVSPGASGFLRVTSDPPGAAVLVDGEPWPEATPTVVESEVGRERAVTLELPDHLRETRTVAAERGGTTAVHVTLRRTPGRLTVRSSPPGARVTVAGRDAGVTPLLLEDLPRRPAEVVVTLAGRAPFETTARLDEEPEVEVEARLQKRVTFGTLDVSSTPWAQVKLGGRVIAESTPALGLRVPVGVHTVVLTNPRLGLSASRRVEIREGERTRLVVRLR